MTTTTAPSTTVTPCPTWCDRTHPDETWHEATLATTAGPVAFSSHEVRMVQSMDLELTPDPDPWLLVMIRGNGISDRGSESVPWTVDELLDVSAMFARAAAALAAVTA